MRSRCRCSCFSFLVLFPLAFSPVNPYRCLSSDKTLVVFFVCLVLPKQMRDRPRQSLYFTFQSLGVIFHQKKIVIDSNTRATCCHCQPQKSTRQHETDTHTHNMHTSTGTLICARFAARRSPAQTLPGCPRDINPHESPVCCWTQLSSSRPPPSPLLPHTHKRQSRSRSSMEVGASVWVADAGPETWVEGTVVAKVRKERK